MSASLVNICGSVSSNGQFGWPWLTIVRFSLAYISMTKLDVLYDLATDGESPVMNWLFMNSGTLSSVWLSHPNLQYYFLWEVFSQSYLILPAGSTRHYLFFFLLPCSKHPGKIVANSEKDNSSHSMRILCTIGQ